MSVRVRLRREGEVKVRLKKGRERRKNRQADTVTEFGSFWPFAISLHLPFSYYLFSFHCSFMTSIIPAFSFFVFPLSPSLCSFPLLSPFHSFA
jgi:hypothetical protein